MVKILEYQLIAPSNSSYSAIEQILINRGLAKNEIYHYLNTTDNDILEPSLISNIKEGVEMLIKNINKHSFTTMIVDPDCDGFTSSAILMNYLNKVFPHFTSEIHYIMHSGKQHGIILDEIPEETKFLICADSASNNYE